MALQSAMDSSTDIVTELIQSTYKASPKIPIQARS